MVNEILVKGADGKWYTMKDGKLLAYDEGSGVRGQVLGVEKELPKGVTTEQHVKLEQVKAPSAPMAPKVVALAKVSTPISHESHPLVQELEEIVDQIVKDSGVTFSDSMLVKRFRMIVSARLRDVRDPVETNAMLLRNQKVGGLEMGETEIDRVCTVMEKAFDVFQMKWKEVEMKRLTDWKKKQAQEREVREGQKEKNEQDELEERYKKLVGSRDVGQSGILPQTRVGVPPTVVHDIPRRAPARADNKFTLDEKNPMPALREGSRQDSRPPHISVISVVGEKGKEKEKKLLVPPRPITIPTKPPISPPKFTQPSAPNPYLPAGKAGNLIPKTSQKITDIRPAPKLLGPVEELSHLTLQDFRRIGTDAAEAAARVEQKIMRLKSESLLRANQGMTAWRSSPLYQQYSQIMNEALSKRMSPDAILEATPTSRPQASGVGVPTASVGREPSLTTSEFHAIMELNQKLRF